MLQYKGYLGSVSYHAEDRVFFGKLEGIRDLVSFEGTDVETLESSFREAIDDYLSVCKEEGREPDKPYKGQFQVRVRPDIHRRLAMQAAQENTNLNAMAEAAFEEFLRLSTISRSTSSRARRKVSDDTRQSA